MKNDEFDLKVLSDPATLYLTAKQEMCSIEALKSTETMDFWALYRVDEVTFEDKAPRKEALENVISSMNIEGVNFIYIIMGNSAGVKFYYGVAKDLTYQGELALEVSEIGEKILKPSLQGNFRGSLITEIDANERKKVLNDIKQFEDAKILQGVPGINKNDEKFQSVDRVIDVMLGDTFALMLIAKPIARDDINSIQNKMYRIYNSIASLAKSSVQESSGSNNSESTSSTTGSSETKGKSSSKSKQHGTGESDSHTDGRTEGTNKSTTQTSNSDKSSRSGSEGTQNSSSKSDAVTKSTNSSTTDTEGSSESTSTNKSDTTSRQSGTNQGSATTIEVVNKKIQDWIRYMDEVIFPRLDYGQGKGLFITSTVLLGQDPASLIKLENTLKSVYGGESGNRMPLRAVEMSADETSLLKKMQIPVMYMEKEAKEDEIDVRTACSQYYIDPGKVLLGNWMSSQEISLIAGLPQKEVVGLALREEVEFGLNVNDNMKDKLLLGHLVQSGVVLDGENGSSNIPVYFDKECFDRHIFVTGVTGGGKTTTCQKLLLASGDNFLVIEPAKTEYRVLAEKDVPDMLVFTLGRENGAPFRLNPFEFFEGENISSRVDMIMASMEAAFDMEAAIPQLFEAAIYECYEDKGWDVATNQNFKYEDPFADGVDSFPTLGELEKKIDVVVKNQNFDDRLRDEYIGSMRARLKGLLVGAKGLMLNTPRSIDFVELLDRKVVLELEYIKSASEKSLIMGFILANLSEAIKVKYREDAKNAKNGSKGIRHITLIEEAHRLLSKYMPGDSLSKKQGVEMFADMIAEVRKYGESLIIADQIPNKLIPEVLKNTNTKIVHKIFAQDDKEAIGNTMALKDEQKEYLSYLPSGRAVMMHPGLSKAIQMQVLRTEENDTGRIPLDDEQLRSRIIDFYISIYKRGVLPGLEQLPEEPNRELVEWYLDNLQPGTFVLKEYCRYLHERKIEDKDVFRRFAAKIAYAQQLHILPDISKVFCRLCHEEKRLRQYPEVYQYVEEVLCQIADKREQHSLRTYPHHDELDGTLKSSIIPRNK